MGEGSKNTHNNKQNKQTKTKQNSKITQLKHNKQGRKEMFYLTTQHFYCGSRKEGNGLFNDALNTFYLRLYGVGHMVKDHSDSERGNPLPPLHGLLFPFSSMGSFICTTHRHDSTYHGLFTPVVEHWLERDKPKRKK